MIDPTRWTLSNHAIERAQEMRLSPREVAELLEQPGIIADQDRRSKYRNTGHKLYMRGDYTAVVSPGAPSVVVTILYRYRDGWRDSAPALGEGRTPRPDSHLPKRPKN